MEINPWDFHTFCNVKYETSQCEPTEVAGTFWYNSLPNMQDVSHKYSFRQAKM